MGRVIVVGDVGDCVREYDDLLKQVNYHTGDHLLAIAPKKGDSTEHVRASGATVVRGKNGELIQHNGKKWIVRHKQGHGDWWARWKGAPTVFGGQIVSRLYPIWAPNAIGINTGCAAGGTLTALVFEQGYSDVQVYAVPSRKIKGWKPGEVRWTAPMPNASVLKRSGDVLGTVMFEAGRASPWIAWIRVGVPEGRQTFSFNSEDMAMDYVEAVSYLATLEASVDMLKS